MMSEDWECVFAADEERREVHSLAIKRLPSPGGSKASRYMALDLQHKRA